MLEALRVGTILDHAQEIPLFVGMDLALGWFLTCTTPCQTSSISGHPCLGFLINSKASRERKRQNALLEQQGHGPDQPQLIFSLQVDSFEQPSSTLRVLPFSLSHPQIKGESGEKELQTKIKSQLDLSPAVWPGASDSTILSFRVLVCDMGMIPPVDGSCQELRTDPLEVLRGQDFACVGYSCVSRTTPGALKLLNKCLGGIIYPHNNPMR